LLQQYGVNADILVCRTEHPINNDIRRKLALFCNVDSEAVIEAMDAKSIYEVPLLMEKERLDVIVLAKLGLSNDRAPELRVWKKFVNTLYNPAKTVRIGLIGKYIELKDSYKSIAESFIHAGVVNETKVEIEWIHSEEISDDNVREKFKGLSGILVAPGFGNRGIEGKIAAIRYARENGLPFFGICLGMQCAVIEFARNVLGMQNAHSTEMNPDTPYPVIDLLEGQKKVTNKGGTMRLGAYPCRLAENSNAHHIYGKTTIYERHRHRFEFNNEYLQQFESHGMIATGINPEGGLVEIVEVRDHPWFVGVQFHPEYKSTVESPQPLFVSFVKAALKISAEKTVKA
jgi:CTP synthase